MKISTECEVLSNYFGEKRAIEILIASGFDAIDLSCFEMFDEASTKMQSNYKEYAKELLQLTEGTGVYFNQAHAPFPSSQNDEEFTRKAFDSIVRSIEFASLLGVRNIIVHPKQHLKYKDNVSYLKDLNLEFYTSLIPYCKDFNITVCAENMWQTDENGIITYSTCASPAEFVEYIDTVGSPYIKACLDIGHAFLVNEDIPAFIHTLGDRLVALHMHDTGCNWDMHVLPHSVNAINWDGVLRALAEIDYKGELTLEADNTLAHMPKELMITTSKFMADVTRNMAKRFEMFRNEMS